MTVSNPKSSKEGVIAEIRVTPSSKEESITLNDGELRVRTRQPADKDKANKAVTKMLRSLFGKCKIVSGEKSRKKKILMQDLDLAGYNAVLRRLKG